MTDEAREFARLRDAAHTADHALERQLHRAAREDADLAAGLEELARHIAAAEAVVDDELRSEHRGRDPERPPFWHRAGTAV